MCEHVSLVQTREALNRRTVETDALRKRAFDFGGGNRHVLQRSQDVGEPQAHKLYAALFDGPKDEILLLVHARLSLSCRRD